MQAAEERCPVLEWLEEPTESKGVRVLVDDEWSFHPYPELADRVLRQAAALAELRVGPGDVVGLSTAQPVDFLTGYHATLYMGATALPLAPPGFLGTGYVQRMARLLEAGRPRVILARPPELAQFQEAVADLGEAGGRTACVEPALDRSLDPPRRGPLPEIALLQFTSGSTGRPRAVQISTTNLEAQTAMIRGVWDWASDEVMASWLPLHHDMGLTGGLLTPVVSQSDIWMLTPEQFLLQPLRWMECFGLHGATITASPNLGYGLSARRVPRESLEGMNFEAWRIAVIGAERVDPRTLQQFLELTGDFGFRPGVFRPAYGLAEATLAVATHPRLFPARVLSVDFADLDVGHPVTVTAEARVGDPAVSTDGDTLVSNGVPLRGMDVRITDESGRSLPEGYLGEVVIGGRSVAHGYLLGDSSDNGDDGHSPDTAAEGRDDGETPSAFRGEEFFTGDAGFFHDGELFVVGRMGDSVSVLGKQVYVEGLEALVAEALDVPASRCVVVPPTGADGAAVGLVVEHEDSPELVAAADKLHWRLGRRVPVRTYAVARGALPRTTSGKVRRRALWRTLLRGDLDAQQLAVVGD